MKMAVQTILKGAGALFVGSFVHFSVLAAAELPGLQGYWKTSEIVVDGKGADWASYDPSGWDGFSICLLNDDQDVYLFLSPWQQEKKDQAGGRFEQSLTFWFDQGKEKRKALGIRFLFEGRALSRQGFWEKGGPEAALLAENRLQRVELIRFGDPFTKLLSTANASGIQAGLGTAESTVVYELKIPLTELNAKSGSSFHLGMETSKVPKNFRKAFKKNQEERMRRFRQRESDEPRSRKRNRADRSEVSSEREGFPRGRPGAAVGWPKPFRLWTPVRLASRVPGE